MSDRLMQLSMTLHEDLYCRFHTHTPLVALFALVGGIATKTSVQATLVACWHVKNTTVIGICEEYFPRQQQSGIQWQFLPRFLLLKSGLRIITLRK